MNVSSPFSFFWATKNGTWGADGKEYRQSEATILDNGAFQVPQAPQVPQRSSTRMAPIPMLVPRIGRLYGELSNG